MQKTMRGSTTNAKRGRMGQRPNGWKAGGVGVCVVGVWGWGGGGVGLGVGKGEGEGCKKGGGVKVWGGGGKVGRVGRKEGSGEGVCSVWCVDRDI